MSVMPPGARIQDFIVERVLGRGGHAAVYRAHHAARPELVVALKVLDENHRGTVELERLQREFAFARQLDHPHVVTVYECGRHWLAMELLSGGIVADAPSLSVRLTALEQIADALDYAHRSGIVHCDVKPSNILLSADFDRFGAKLIDFGVARSAADAEPAARTTHLAGTLPYAAPELLRGGPPTPASDEYALACTLVEVLTGTPPFRSTNAMALVDAHLHADPPRISRHIVWIPHAVDSILAKAMAKDPSQRYGSCARLVALISRAVR